MVLSAILLRNVFESASHNIDTVCIHAQLHLTLCDPIDYSPQGSSVHGISQAGILESAAISYSRDLPDPGIEPKSLVSPILADRFFTTTPLLAQNSLPTFNFFFCPSSLHQCFSILSEYKNLSVPLSCEIQLLSLAYWESLFPDAKMFLT